MKTKAIVLGLTTLFLANIYLMNTVNSENQEILFHKESYDLTANKNPDEMKYSKDFIIEELHKLGFKNVEVESQVINYEHLVKVSGEKKNGEKLNFDRKMQEIIIN